MNIVMRVRGAAVVAGRLVSVVVILEPILSVVVGVVEVVLRMAQTEKSASAGTAAQRRVVADILFVAVLFGSVGSDGG